MEKVEIGASNGVKQLIDAISKIQRRKPLRCHEGQNQRGKKEQSYSDMITYIRTKTSFQLLRSSILRMWRAVNTRESRYGSFHWSHSRKGAAVVLNDLKSSIQISLVSYK